MQELKDEPGTYNGGASGSGTTTAGVGLDSATVAAAPKADLGKRFIAAVIDAVIAAVLGVIPVVGGLVGAAYMVVRDGLDVDFMRNRSLGKKIMKLRPVHMDGSAIDLQASFRRNWMFGIGALTGALIYIPILGWVLIPIVALVGLVIGVFEIIKVFSDPEGRRWGDNLADTKVLEVQE